MKPIYLFFTSILTASFIHHYAYSTDLPNAICQRLLSPEETSAYTSIESEIARRTRLVRDGSHLLVTQEGNIDVSIPTAMDIAFAPAILEHVKMLALKRVDLITQEFIPLVRQEVLLRHEALKAAYTKKLAEAKISGQALIGKSGARIGHVGIDVDGLPDVELVQQHRNLALHILQKQTSKPGLVEIEILVAKALLDGIKDKKSSDIEYEGLKQKYKRKIRQIVDEEVEAAEKLIAETKGRISPNFSQVTALMQRVLEEFAGEVLDLFHFKNLSAVADTGLQSKLSIALNSVNSLSLDWSGIPRTKKNDRGEFEIHLQDPAIRAVYLKELGTMLLHSVAGIVPNRHGIVLAADHGAGTVKSNAASWKYILPKLVKSGTSPMAVDLPMTLIGMDLRGLHSTLAFFQHRFHWMSELVARETIGDVAQIPIVQLGRSASAQHGFLHSIAFAGESNPVSAYVLMSLSNPYTTEVQNANITKQVQQGHLKGKMPEQLANADLIDLEARSLLERLKKENPDFVKNNGDLVLLFQGDADQDGGPTVLADLKKLLYGDQDGSQGFAPRAHLYEFHDPTLPLSLPYRDQIDPDMFEGSHYIMSNSSNMSEAQGKKVFPDLNPELYPALADQYFEAMAVMYSFFDYIVGSKSQNIEVLQSQKKFKRFREQVCGLNLSFFEWFLNREGIELKDVLETSSLEKGKKARAKRVIEYWENEKKRLLEMDGK